MSFTLGNGWDGDFGYFSLRGHMAMGQNLHHQSRKAQAYGLPEGFLPGLWKKYCFLRSVKRGSGLRLDSRNGKLFRKCVNRNPTFYSGGFKPIDLFKVRHRRWPNYSGTPATSVIEQTEDDCGPRQITIEVSAETARLLAELSNRCTEADQEQNSFTSHGPLTVDGLIAMLVEDAAMVISRPGSWEGSNMERVFAGHGYQV